MLKKTFDTRLAKNKLDAVKGKTFSFTFNLSVAKTYSPNNINYYAAIRGAYRNVYNMKLIYARANDLKKEDEDVIKINKSELDLSFFDNQSPLPYYEFKVNENTQTFNIF